MWTFLFQRTIRFMFKVNILKFVYFCLNIKVIAEEPGIAREKKILKKYFFFSYYTPGHPWVSTNNVQPNRSSRLAGYKQHIYECLVLLYRFIYSFNLVCEAETLLEVLSVKYGNRYSSVLINKIQIHFVKRTNLTKFLSEWEKH